MNETTKLIVTVAVAVAIGVAIAGYTKGGAVVQS